MSQKQKFHHNNNTPTPPAEGWAPAYKNLDNPLFNSLIADLNEGHILPTEKAAKVYNKNPYLWPINLYRSLVSSNEQSLVCQQTKNPPSFHLCLLRWLCRSICQRRSLSQVPSWAATATVNSPPSPSTSSLSHSQATPHQPSLHLVNLSLQKE
jgi:hypothetical protein